MYDKHGRRKFIASVVYWFIVISMFVMVTLVSFVF